MDTMDVYCCKKNIKLLFQHFQGVWSISVDKMAQKWPKIIGKQTQIFLTTLLIHSDDIKTFPNGYECACVVETRIPKATFSKLWDVWSHLGHQPRQKWHITSKKNQPYMGIPYPRKQGENIMSKMVMIFIYFELSM